MKKHSSSIKKIVSCIIASLVCTASLLSFGGCKCAHANGESEITIEPTCTTLGEEKFTCFDCGQTITNSIPLNEHDYSVLVSDTATCQSSGEYTYQCSMCKAEKTEFSARKSHEFAGAFCKYCKVIDDDYNKININSSFDDIYNYYTHSSGSYMIFLRAEEGSTQVEMSVFASGNYSCSVFLMVSLVNNTTKTFETTLMKSGRLQYNSLITLSDTETMSTAFNSSYEYYVSVSITVL